MKKVSLQSATGGPHPTQACDPAAAQSASSDGSTNSWSNTYDPSKCQSPALPDLDQCLVNFANSILVNFGAKSTVPTLPLADRYLAKNYRNVVVLLLDAMGTAILQKHLSPDGFFRKHLAGSMSSVFPPTTVAATTSIITGQYPCEHAWLGWDCYYPQLQKNVTVYLNSDQLTEANSAFAKEGAEIDEPRDGFPPLEKMRPAADFHVGFTYTPYKDVISKITEAGGNAFYSSPFVTPNPQTLDEILTRVKTLCAEPGRKFVYAYWNEPDGTMHKTGTTSDATHEVITAIEKQVESFAGELPDDTLLFITADHGHMDSRNVCLLDYPEITKCLVRLPSIEPRALNLFVKDEYKESFPSLWKSTFGEKFLLLSRDEVIAKKLFGPVDAGFAPKPGDDESAGEDAACVSAESATKDEPVAASVKAHPLFRDMLGDYLAIAISDLSIFNTHIEAHLMPGGHAGLTQEELEIPLIAVEKGVRK
ncbi:MAG: alkaline phosphatase family protein [Lachnospiraceae bacterium]|nr:alkaline phosphatase family protein [Lachnospiraceae bacterium]